MIIGPTNSHAQQETVFLHASIVQSWKQANTERGREKDRCCLRIKVRDLMPLPCSIRVE